MNNANEMTVPEADVKAFGRWLAKAITVLKLDPYRVLVNSSQFEDIDENEGFHFGEIGASIRPMPEYWMATLRLDVDYHLGTPEGIARTLTHELCHLMFAHSGRLLFGLNDNVMGSGVVDWAAGEIRMHHESEIERLSQVVLPLMPKFTAKLQGAQPAS